jgi:hypothetical protein
VTSYDLNLALVFTCMLAIVSYAAFSIVPAAVAAVLHALAGRARALRVRIRSTTSRGPAARAANHPWWGPYSQ